MKTEFLSRLSHHLNLFPDTIKIPSELIEEAEKYIKNIVREVNHRSTNAPSFDCWGVFELWDIGGEEPIEVFINEEDAEDYIKNNDHFGKWFMRSMIATA